MDEARPSQARLETNKKASALRHINAAIAHLGKGEIDCAITLAAAGEGMLAATDEPYLFKGLRGHPEADDIDFNLVINWLKHPGGPEELNIPEFEAAVVIASLSLCTKKALAGLSCSFDGGTRRDTCRRSTTGPTDPLPESKPAPPPPPMADVRRELREIRAT